MLVAQNIIFYVNKTFRILMSLGAVGNSNTLDISEMFNNSQTRNCAADTSQNPGQKKK